MAGSATVIPIIAPWIEPAARISIPYITEAGNQRLYKPDFLIEKFDGSKEIHEVKGGHLIQNFDWKRKKQAAESWCKNRGMKFLIISK